MPRQVAADDFFHGFLETAVGEAELLTEIRVPKAIGAGWSFQKFNRRAQDWATVGVAYVRRADDQVGVGLVNMDSRPVHAAATEAAIASGALDRRRRRCGRRGHRAGSRPQRLGRVPAPPGAQVLTGRALAEASS